ncbi:hypothetical protein [Cronobacter turicensis]|uniref:hypothetical protein n=1 Tax=Cronobacter turicensis TaxID=413502 RepID=UPI0011AD96A9|nr:hypothetical protein [Cronobacter turicensis]TWR33034.1 hypothetical protein FQY85_16220 [Cronobacter turicensis]
MRTTRVTLRLSHTVSDVMLDDIKAIIPADALQVFTNQLDETQYATLECLQTEQYCSLIASAIVVWRQLGHVKSLIYRNGDVLRDVSDASQFQLFTMLRAPLTVLAVR